MVLDATVGGASADAYLTVAAADIRAGLDLGRYAADWTEKATEVAANGPNRLRKEAAIRRATLDVEALGAFVREPWTELQARAFPRDVDVILAIPFVPESILRATFVQAIYLFANAESIDDASSRRARAMTNFSEPVVSGSLSLDPAFGRYAPELEAILRPLAEGAVIGVIVRA